MRRIVHFSGGVSSWAAAKRVVQEHGVSEVTLLFADTRMEDEDLYRFLVQAAGNVGAPLVVIADGRTPWQVMKDSKFIGNSRIDPCSKELKRKLLDSWVRANCSAEDMHYIGLSWEEINRVEKFLQVFPWKACAPLCEPPYLTKAEQLSWLNACGLKVPRLYDLGFPHNNCGGFCIKAGQSQFALLLEKFPDRYLWHEAQEEALREIVGDHSIMRDRRGGVSNPLTMRQFRERLQAGGKAPEFDWGGCGCAIE